MVIIAIKLGKAVCLKYENIRQIIFKDDSTFDLNVIYSRPDYEQHCKVLELLGCESTNQGLPKVDMFQKTSVPNIFACGDNSNLLRSLAIAILTGNVIGVAINNIMTEEEL